MIDQTDITRRYLDEEKYKTKERRARKLIGNAMNLLIEANRLRNELTTMVQPDGDAPLAAELAAYQLTRNDPPDRPGATAALLAQITQSIDGLHQLLWMMEAASLASGGGAVFGIPEWSPPEIPEVPDEEDPGEEDPPNNEELPV